MTMIAQRCARTSNPTATTPARPQETGSAAPTSDHPPRHHRSELTIMHRLGTTAVAATLVLAVLLLAATFVYAVITPHVTPELVALGFAGVALLQVGLLSRGHVDGVRETVDRLAAVLDDRGR